MTKKHKNELPSAERSFFEQVPGVVAMDRLFSGLRGILFCLKDRSGRYLAANDPFLRRVRIDSRDGLIGRTARELFPDLLAAGYAQQDAVVLRGEGREVRDRLEMITNPDGSLGWYLTDKVPVMNSNGAVVGIACVSRDLHLPATDDPRIGDLARALRRLRREYATPLRIGDLAAESGMSLSKFERLMRSILHVSPRQLLTRIRVEAAAEQLRLSNTPLGEIALQCGFYDQATFCHQFKAVTGLTASRYRKLSREGERKR